MLTFEHYFVFGIAVLLIAFGASTGCNFGPDAEQWATTTCDENAVCTFRYHCCGHRLCSSVTCAGSDPVLAYRNCPMKLSNKADKLCGKGVWKKVFEKVCGGSMHWVFECNVMTAERNE